MFYAIYLVSSIATLHFIIHNLGYICFYLINLYSRVELLLRHQRKLTQEYESIENTEDMLDCLVGNKIIHCNARDNAVEKINGSEFTVLISGNNMVCFYPPIEKYYSTYESSNVRFISVKIEINSVEYDIKMNSPTHSFYVVGNDLNVDWVRYYFLKFSRIELPADIEYQMTVIDDDVNFVYLNQNECISLELDEYAVYEYEEQITTISVDESGSIFIHDTSGDNIVIHDNTSDELNAMLEIESDMRFETRTDAQEKEEEDDVPLCILEEDELLDRAIAEYETTF